MRASALVVGGVGSAAALVGVGATAVALVGVRPAAVAVERGDAGPGRCARAHQAGHAGGGHWEVEEGCEIYAWPILYNC